MQFQSELAAEGTSLGDTPVGWLTRTGLSHLAGRVPDNSPQLANPKGTRPFPFTSAPHEPDPTCLPPSAEDRSLRWLRRVDRAIWAEQEQEAEQELEQELELELEAEAEAEEEQEESPPPERKPERGARRIYGTIERTARTLARSPEIGFSSPLPRIPIRSNSLDFGSTDS